MTGSSILSRRHLLQLGLAAAGSAAMPRVARSGEPLLLAARPGDAALRGPERPPTVIWGYDGQAPGPVLRYRQGDRLLVDFQNELPQPSTVHWHGIRLPNAMDGVPLLTQPAVEPGGRFRYEFALTDAGTFWYHPHVRSAEQVDRGLAGALVVEEREPIRVDREILWLLDDWRLDPDGGITEDFDNPLDHVRAGRIGNHVTINGAPPSELVVRAGERIRLRLVNIANARIFGLVFDGQEVAVIALDGQPTAPHAPAEGQVVLAPGQRADLVLDMSGRPGERFAIRDRYYPETRDELAALVYADETPLRESPLDAPIALPANPIPAPELAGATLLPLLFDLDPASGHWRVNGRAGLGHGEPPLFQAQLGETCLLHLHNDSDFDHPIHLHGYAFRVLKRGAEPLALPEWRDTLLLRPRQSMEVAFRADNPGAWMLHCHILEHQTAGMMGHFEIG